jgi:hypothetical protein
MGMGLSLALQIPDRIGSRDVVVIIAADCMKIDEASPTGLGGGFTEFTVTGDIVSEGVNGGSLPDSPIPQDNELDNARTPCPERFGG